MATNGYKILLVMIFIGFFFVMLRTRNFVKRAAPIDPIIMKNTDNGASSAATVTLEASSSAAATPAHHSTNTAAAEYRVTDQKGTSVSSRSATDTRSLLISLGVPTCAIDIFERNYERLEDAATAQGEDVHPERRRTQDSLQGTGIYHGYMIHDSHLNRQRRMMTDLLDRHKVNVHWVLGFDKDALTPGMVRCFQSWQPTEYEKKYPAKAKRHRQQPAQRMKLSQVSAAVKHHSALYDLVRNNYPNAMILEDDALLRNGFKWQVKEVMDEADANVEIKNWDMMMIGGCKNMHAFRSQSGAKAQSKHLYEKRESRCAHAYVVTQRGAQQLLAGIPLTSPIDLQIGSAMKERKMQCLWVEPFLSEQGNLAGGCLTNELGNAVNCVSHHDPNFDLKFENDTKLAAKNWEQNP